MEAVTLKQQAASTLLATFLHNQYAFAFSLGIIISLVILLHKPNRNTVLFLISFIILFIAFEYDKHIVSALEEQTINSMALTQGGAMIWLKRALYKILPFLFFITGWGTLFLAIILQTIADKSRFKG